MFLFQIARLEKIIEQLQRRLREMENSSQCQCDDCIELRTEIDIYGTLVNTMADKSVLLSSSSSSSSEGENIITADSKLSSSAGLTTSSSMRRTQHVTQHQTFKQ